MSATDKKLEGKIAVITGGNSGIGLATAKHLVDEGAFVFITGRRQKELDTAVAEIGKNVRGVQGDVQNLKDLDRLYQEVKAEKGHIDILFANAGTSGFLPLQAVTEEHFDKIFNTNVKGLVFTVQKALPLLRDGGSIILNASVAGFKGIPAFSIYSATKAAVRSFARTWTADLKERRIRVNAISPGMIPTPGFGNIGLTDEQIQQMTADAIARIPLARTGTTDEVAKVVSFLASSDSSYIAGVDLCVDGGLAQV